MEKGEEGLKLGETVRVNEGRAEGSDAPFLCQDAGDSGAAATVAAAGSAAGGVCGSAAGRGRGVSAVNAGTVPNDRLA